LAQPAVKQPARKPAVTAHAHLIDSFIPVAPNPAAVRRVAPAAKAPVTTPITNPRVANHSAALHNKVIDPVFGRAVTHRTHAQPVQRTVVEAVRSQLVYTPTLHGRRRSIDGFIR
jgi:hypothetical protein